MISVTSVPWPQISGKDSPTHATSNSRSPFPYLCTKKLSRTCCACSRGGSLFLPYPKQPHPLSPLIMVRLKMTSLETFQSNMITNTTKRYVDCSAVSGDGRVQRRCWVNFQCRGVLLVWMIGGQGLIALAVGAGGSLFGHFFSHLSFLFSFSLSLGDGPI